MAQYRPDVVVMDLRMRRVDGIEATRRLAGGPPVLALTTFNEGKHSRVHCVPAQRVSCSKTLLPRS